VRHRLTHPLSNVIADAILRIAEMNLLSLCFLGTATESKVLAMLFLDNKERIQLHARDIDCDLKNHQVELSQAPSSFLLPSFVPSKCFSFPDASPILVAVSPSAQSSLDGDFLGGVLVLGGRKILLYEFADQDKYNSHEHRKRQSLSRSKVDDARKHERERVRKPTASVVWPWSNVTA
jgi:DNA damage-binding protein 1